MTTINVNNSHIARGIRHDQSMCPIGLAIEEQIPNLNLVEVGDREISLWAKGYPSRFENYPMPFEARDFVSAFDNGQLVQPLTFELD